MSVDMIIGAFKFNREQNSLKVLDQTKLPTEIKYISVEGKNDGFRVIKDMIVRGAPCIAAVGCLSLVIDMNNKREELKDVESLLDWFRSAKKNLQSSRPTAVNLEKALSKVLNFLIDHQSNSEGVGDLIDGVSDYCDRAISQGLAANRRLGVCGADELLKVSKNKNGKLSILTHCNTGSLATVGFGTALGVIRSLHERSSLLRAYCTETRPYNQGSRLTAWELVEDKVPATLISDSMVAYLMATHQIDGVVVGADRVVANGDTANKIGTLQIAVIAKHFGVPFYVAAPTQTIDLATSSAHGIQVEQRLPDELRRYAGIQIAPDNVDVWNPCFDITPGEFISGIITEYGVCHPNKIVEFFSSDIVKQLRSLASEALF